jgi:hypothetical protein
MKKRILGLIIVAMIMALSFSLCACGKKDAEPEGAAYSDSQETEETSESDDDALKVVRSFDEIDVDCEPDEPLQIDSVTLYEDGTVRLVPLEDLKKNAEDNDELKDGAMYPFADAGKVKDIYLVRFGNGGYRTVIALMEDGTLSALSANELIKDHIAVVMPNMSGRDNFVSVEQRESEDAFGVVGITEDGDEVELDDVLDF